MAPLQRKPQIPADPKLLFFLQRSKAILRTNCCYCCCSLPVSTMKDRPSSSHKKRKITRLETTIGPVAFSTRKKRRGANGATTSSDTALVTQSQTLDYFRESPPRRSPFASPTIRTSRSPLAYTTAINEMITGGPVGGLTLGTPVAARQLFDVPAHNQKKSK